VISYSVTETERNQELLSIYEFFNDALCNVLKYLYTFSHVDLAGTYTFNPLRLISK